MIKYDISAILPPDNGYRNIKCINQQWQVSSFSYLETPRPDNGIVFVTHGQIRFDFSGEQLTARGGDLVFLPQGSFYRAVVLQEFGQTRDYLVNFEVDAPARGSIPEKPVKLLENGSMRYLSLFERITALQLQGEAFLQMSTFFLLLDTLCRDLKSEADPGKEALLRRMQALLTDGSERPVAEIAALCGISESGMRGMFKGAYGCSPLQYRMEDKISKAKFLLESTDMPVYAVAQSLHFYDEAYFCKMFRKYAGCSPKKYVKSITL